MTAKKKRIVVILSIALCMTFLVLSFGITLAYLNYKVNLTNTFTIGENAIQIIEEFEPPEKLGPDMSFKKSPTVKNTGNLPCFVRMRADFSDSKMKDLCEDLDIDTTCWIYNDTDGYYYYNQLILPDETTKPLFNKVVIMKNKKSGEEITEADMRDFDVLIYAESKQHQDHSGDHNSDEYTTVWQ